MISPSVTSDSLQPFGLYPVRLLSLWDSPSKTIGVGCHALLQGIFLDPGPGMEPLSPVAPALQVDSLPAEPLGKPHVTSSALHMVNSSTLLSYKNFLSYARRQWHPTPVLLPGKFHGRRSLVGCSPWGRKESDTTERLHFHFSFSCIGEGNGNPLQYCCLENPRDGGAWWAAVYGVAQSRTRLKQLSSSSRHSIRHPTEHKGREDSSLNCLCSITHPHEQRVYQEILPGGLTWPLGPFIALTLGKRYHNRMFLQGLGAQSLIYKIFKFLQ